MQIQITKSNNKEFKLDQHIYEFKLFESEINVKFDKVNSKLDILFTLPKFQKNYKIDK